VADWRTAGPALNSERGCFMTEANAFQTQAATWLELEGGQLRLPANDVEAELNAIVQAIATDPSGFLSHLQTVYHHECSGT
jgi:hypothetical protein